MICNVKKPNKRIKPTTNNYTILYLLRLTLKASLACIRTGGGCLCGTLQPNMTYHRVLNKNDFIDLLEKACNWLDIDKGRAKDYIRIIKECETLENHELSQEHILVHNESWEIVDIYELWKEHTNNFLGLEKKIKRVLKKGTILREDEIDNKGVKSSSIHRNNAFTYFLAGKLLQSSLNVVVVDEISSIYNNHKVNTTDVTIEWNGLPIDIECKRPQHIESLNSNLEEADDQIKKRDRHSVIAVDCSPFIRPLGKLIIANSSEEAGNKLSQMLEIEVKQNIEKYLYKKKIIIGAILFARVPFNCPTKVSSVLSTNGKPFSEYRPESVVSYLIINNIDVDKNYENVMQFIFKKLETHDKGNPG